MTRPKAGAVPKTGIDREKLRVALHDLSEESVLSMLNEAIDLLSPVAMATLVSGYFPADRLRPEAQGRGRLLEEVRQFDMAARRGKFYDAFDVDSKSYMDVSKGTTTFIAEFTRMLRRCAAQAKAQAKTGEPAETCAAFDVLSRLADQVDACEDDVIFVADEGLEFAEGVDWAEILPAWFTCLAATTTPEEYAKRVAAIVRKRGSHRDRGLAAAAQAPASPAQTAALAKVRGLFSASAARSRSRR